MIIMAPKFAPPVHTNHRDQGWSQQISPGSLYILFFNLSNFNNQCQKYLPRRGMVYLSQKKALVLSDFFLFQSFKFEFQYFKMRQFVQVLVTCLLQVLAPTLTGTTTLAHTFYCWGATPTQNYSINTEYICQRN